MPTSRLSHALKLTVLSAVLLCPMVRAACILPSTPPLLPQLLSDVDDESLQQQFLNQTLYLEPRINGYPVGDTLMPFQLRDGYLIADSSALKTLGLPIDQACLAADGSLPLDAWQDVRYHYQAASQSIDFEIDPNLLSKNVLNARQALILEPQSNTGVLLNYNLFGFQSLDADRRSALSSSLDLRGFTSDWGTLQHQQVLRHDFEQNRSESLRLSSQWHMSDANRLISVDAGDVISGGLAWTRPVRLGGARFARNFSLQPNFITTPGALANGSAALPSTVEVYVNNVRQYSSEVRPGQFEIQNLPVVNGAGTVQLRIRDILGRETVQSFSIYAAQRLLRVGLLDFSTSAGYLRQNFGVDSFNYDNNLATSTSLRYGLRYNWTIEAHSEIGDGFWNLGYGQVVASERLGQLSMALAGSGGPRGHGQRWFAAHEYFSPHFSTRLAWQQHSDDFTDLASLDGNPSSRQQWQASLSLPLLSRSNLGLNYLHIKTAPRQEDIGTASDNNGSSIENLSLSLSQRFSIAAGIYAALIYDLDSDDYAINVGLNWRLGTRRSAFSNYTQTDSSRFGGIAARQSLPLDGRAWGWDVGSSWGDREQLSAGLARRGAITRSELRMEQFAESEQMTADVRGAAAFIDGSWLASNSVNDSFALVRTHTPGIPVLRENRTVGYTNEDGELLIPQLSAYQRNRLAIDPLLIAADYSVPLTEQYVVPHERSGVVVNFPVKVLRSALVQLQLPNGEPVPTGASLHLNGQASEHPVGYDGMAYFDGLQPQNTAMARWNGTRCWVSFDYDAQDGQIPQIGPLRCKLEKLQ